MTSDPTDGKHYFDCYGIHIVVDATPEPPRLRGREDRPVGLGFAEHPALTAGAIHETVACFVTELIKQAGKLPQG